METTSGGGPLQFEAIIKTTGYQKGIDEMADRIKRFSDEGESQTTRVDRAMDKLGATIAKVPNQITATTNALKEQKDIIKQIEADIAATEKAIENAAPGKGKNELFKELHATKRALDEEKVSLAELEIQVGKTGQAKVNLETQIRNLKNEMASMELAGQRNTDVYRELSEEAALLYDAYRDVTKQTKILAHEQAGFQGVISGVAGLTGAFSAAQGTMALFAGKSENLIKIQTRVQALMAMTIGLQQVANNLDKDSAFRIVVVERVTLAWGKAQTFLNTQLGISVGLSKALMFGGIGLLIAGVGLLIHKFSSWNKEQERANELQKKLSEISEKTSLAVAKEKAEVETLRLILNSANASYHEKYEALKNLQGIIPGYNAQLTKEGELVVENTKAYENYIDSIRRTALIKANQEKLSDLFVEQERIKEALQGAKELYDREQEIYQQRLEHASKASTGAKAALRAGSTGAAAITLPEAPSQNQIDKYTSELERITGEIQKIVTKGAQDLVLGVDQELSDMNFDQLLVEWLIRGNDQALKEARSRLTTENAAQAYVQALQSIRGELETEGREYQKVVTEINRMSTPEVKSKLVNETTETFAEQLREIREQYEMFYQWVEFIGQDAAEGQFAGLIKNGDSFLQYVNRQISELERLKQQQGLTSEQSFEFIRLRQQQGELTGQQSRLEAFRNEIAEKKEGYASLSEYIIFLQGEIDKLNQIESESSVEKAGVLGSELQKARQEQGNIFAKLLQDTTSFEEKVTSIRQKYAGQRAELLAQKETMSDEEMQRRLAVIARMEDEELDSEKRIALERSELYKDLHKQVLSIGRRELQERIEIIRKIIAAEKEKAEALGLSTDHLEDFELHLKSLELSMAGLTAEAFRSIASALRSMSGLAGQFDKDLEQALITVSELAGGLADAAEGIALLIATEGGEGWGQATSGLLQIVKTVVGMFKDDSLKRVLSEIKEFNHKIFLGELELNAIYRERARIQQGMNESRLKAIEKENQLLKEQQNYIFQEYLRVWNELNNEKYLEGTERQRRSFFQRLFGDNYETVEVWKSLAGKTYDEIEALFLQRRLSDQAEELFRKLQELKNEGLDIDSILAENARKLQELFTGTTAESIAQSIADGFASGKRSLADFAEDFENMIRKSIISGFAARNIEPALQHFFEMFASLAEDGLTDTDINALRESYATLLAQLGEQFSVLEQIAGITFEGAREGLSGAIKGITEETAGKLEGYINAMRIAQAEQIYITNHQLTTLLVIAANTAYNKHLTQLSEIKDLLKDIKRTGRGIGLLP